VEQELAYGVESAAARQALLKQASESRMRVGITFTHLQRFDPDKSRRGP
jgi:hypothetical protein